MLSMLASAIDSGEVQTGKQLIIRCVKNSGLTSPCIPSSELIEKIKNELTEFSKKTPEELEDIIIQEYENKIRFLEEEMKHCEAKIEKYKKILREVQEWEAPYSLNDMKMLIISNLNGDIKEVNSLKDSYDEELYKTKSFGMESVYKYRTRHINDLEKLICMELEYSVAGEDCRAILEDLEESDNKSLEERE